MAFSVGGEGLRAALIHEHGGRDKLVVTEIERTPPDPGEVSIAVQACGINHLDVFVRRGLPGVPIAMPHIGGGDIVGVIAELGSGVEGVGLGQRVMVDPMVKLPDGRLGVRGEHVSGGLAEYVNVGLDAVIPLPDDLPFIQAAALPLAYGSAWRLLVTRGHVKAGEHVLILGAAGGVGTACVQIAHNRGCVVYAAAGSEDKLTRLKALGADVLVNYAEHPEFHRYVRSLRGGSGVDVTVDNTGATTWVRSLKSLNVDGRLLTCGATAGFDPQTDIRYIWTRELHVIGSDGVRRSDLIQLLEAVGEGRIRPVVDRVLDLDNIREAHRLLEEREVFGKVVVALGAHTKET